MTANAPIDTHAQFLRRAMAWIGDEAAHTAREALPAVFICQRPQQRRCRWKRRAAGGL